MKKYKSISAPFVKKDIEEDDELFVDMKDLDKELENDEKNEVFRGERRMDDEESSEDEVNKKEVEDETLNIEEEKEQLLKSRVKNDKNEKIKMEKEYDKIIKLREASEKIENILETSIKKRENTSKLKLELADSINFKSINDKIIETDQFGFIKEKGDSNKEERDFSSKEEALLSNALSSEENNGEKDEFLIKENEGEMPLEESNDDSYNKTHIKEVLQVNARIEKWTYMLDNYSEFVNGKFEKLKTRTRKGIPDNLRSLVWPMFANVSDFYQENLFSKLESLPLDKKNESIIIKDLDRTFPCCQFFMNKYGDGQRKLYKVLTNYSKFNTVVGYVQGMAFIAALFLTYMSEENSFYCLHSLMKSEKYKMEGFYLPGFPELNKVFFVYLNLLKKFVPKVYSALKYCELMPSGYASQWFICLFCCDLKFDILVRIIDCFLLEGYKVIYRFVLAFLKLKESDFIKCNNDMVEICQVLKRVMQDDINVEMLFNTAFKLPLSRKHIICYEEEYERVKNDRNNEFIQQL